jgi:GalNAc-alpha-(1->4)-GalNAc-alpha-(1->3)-diNAcBac-PP-undecaprenol alpha-1,4-N-acetyl-D-galactosaminyltransferase
MKLTLVISSLSSGGAERVITLLSKGFIERGYDVTVITLSGKDTDFYQLPAGVSRLALGITNISPTPLHALWNNWYRLLTLRRAIQSTHPDVVISHLSTTNVLTILSLFQTSYPIIVTEHNDSKKLSLGKVWKMLRHLTYPYASMLVSVSQGVDEGFDWLSKTKRAVIYNPLVIIEDGKETDLPQAVDPNKLWITAMGRLIYQKGFDLLLSAFHQVADKYPDWQLVILGKGELRPQLENMAKNLGLSERVIFLGTIRNPFPVLRNSKLFVMSSRHEGFPMAHGEALACGLPVIATNCPSGVGEIIRDGIDGILVPNEDVSALATAMERLMSNEEERKRLAARAPEVSERFSLEKVMEMWETLISKIIKKSSINY